MKKLLLLSAYLIFGLSGFGQAIHFQKTDQGVKVLKGSGTPTVTVNIPKGSQYTDTVTGLSFTFTTTDWETNIIAGPQGRSDLGVISTHNYSGGTMSGFAATTFTVTAGVGYIVTGFDPEPFIQEVKYNANITITPAKQSVNIFINSSAELIQLDADSAILSAQVLRDNIFLGSIANIAGTIITISQTPTISIGTAARLEAFMRCIGAVACDGDSIKANGANLAINRTAGHTSKVASNFVNDPSIPDVTTDAVDDSIVDPGDFSKAVIAYLSATPPGFNFESFGNIEPNSWDDATGTKGVVANGKWTIARVFFFNATNTYIIQLGQTEYNMFADAVAGITSEQFIRAPNVLDDAILLASIVVKQGETSLLSADTLIKQADQFGNP